MSSLESQNLKIITMFEIFVVSGIGYFGPIIFSRRKLDVESTLSSNSFRIMKSLSAGIIIGVSFLHLLSDSLGKIDTTAVNGYPLALLMFIVGLVVTLGLEQLAVHSMNYVNADMLPSNGYKTPTNKEKKNSSFKGSVVLDSTSLKYRNSISATGSIEDIEIATISSPSDVLNVSRDSHDECGHGHGHGHSHGGATGSTASCEHAHSIHMVPDLDLRKVFIKAIIMESSISVHSVIIGVAQGLLQDPQPIKVLMIAFAFHQLFEGISLGTSVAESKLNNFVMISFGIMFCLTLPIGVIIGMFSSESASSDNAMGYLNAFAAGSLLYVGLIEMAAEEFSDVDLNDRPILKLFMFIALIFGISLMATLAIWA